MQNMLNAISRLRDKLFWKLSRLFPSNSAIQFALGIIYLWFGVLKFFPGVSPAEKMIFSVFSSYFHVKAFTLFLASLECLIGIAMLSGYKTRVWALIILIHILGTFSVIFLAPQVVFSKPFHIFFLTMEGQYIVKNLLIVAAAIILLSQDVRKSERHTFRTIGYLEIDGKKYKLQTKDLSKNALAFYLDKKELELSTTDSDKIVDITLFLPLTQESKEVKLKVLYVKKGKTDSSVEVIGNFVNQDEASLVFLPYL